MSMKQMIIVGFVSLLMTAASCDAGGAEQNHPDVVKLLVERGADVNAQSKKELLKKQYGVVYAMKEGAQMGGMTPLVLAAREGALDSLAALLAAKADPNKTSGDGSSAL